MRNWLWLAIVSVAVFQELRAEARLPPVHEYDAPPATTLYGSQPGAIHLPDFLDPAIARGLNAEVAPPKRPVDHYMASTDPAKAMPQELPPTQTSGMSAQERTYFEDRVSELTHALNTINASATDHVMGVALAPQAVVAELSFAANLYNESISHIIVRALASVSQVDAENVRFLVLDESKARVAVLPSFDFVMESDGSVILERLNNSVHDGVLVRALNRDGVALAPADIRLLSAPRLVDIQHWTAQYQLTVVGEDPVVWKADLRSLATQIVMEQFNLTESNVQVTVTHIDFAVDAKVDILIRLWNNTDFPLSLEGYTDALNQLCEAGELLKTFAEKVQQSLGLALAPVLELQCLGDAIITREIPPVFSMGMGSECFGHGHYNAATDSCVCTPQWKGRECSNPRCPIGIVVDKGVNINELECSGQGTCRDPWAVCDCADGFRGIDCSEIHQCSPDAPVQCSGHGSCTADNTETRPHSNFSCKCFDGWNGTQCERKELRDKCPVGLGKKAQGKWGFVPCSGLGDCHCQDNTLGDTQCECVCVKGRTGVSCQKKMCADHCNGNGVCFDGECLCRTGWTGPSCNIRAVCADSCNHRGACVEGQCVCRPHFAGLACEINDCETGASRRVVNVITNITVAGDQTIWKVDNDATVGPFPSYTSSYHQHCLSVGEHSLGAHTDDGAIVSVAYAHASSSQLDIPLVKISERLFNFTVESECLGSPSCSARGSCVHGQCCCSAGWEGSDCETEIVRRPAVATCEQECPAHHVCDTAQNCVCTREHEKVGLCSRNACPFKEDSCGVCSGHGDCFSGKCKCDVREPETLNGDMTGWFGNDCSQPINCPNNCGHAQGKGHCDLELGKCVCADSFRGSACEELTCPGSPPCNDHGLCQPDGTCVCSVGWDGLDCNSKSCIGGCLSGKCVGGACVCAPNWSGTRCEIPATCEAPQEFSNCTASSLRRCDRLDSLTSFTDCVPGCTCPRERPLWDEQTKQCVTVLDCSGSCWGKLTPSPNSVAFTIEPVRQVVGDTMRICSYRQLRVCYKADAALIDGNSPTGMIAHARKYHSPIGISVYDSHGERMFGPWAKAAIEEDGKMIGLFGAEAGYAVMSFPVFGSYELRFFIVGPSSTSPIILARQKIFAFDCDTSMEPPFQAPSSVHCSAPTELPNGAVHCDATIPGSMCKFECDDGFILSHLERSRLLCLSNGQYEAPLPQCIPLSAAADCSGSREGQVCVLDEGDFPFGVCANSVCASRTSVASKTVLTEFGSHRSALRMWAESVRQKHAQKHN